MINGNTISLVIPCKNEASSLPKLLKRIPSSIDEILIIDNNSSDNTKGVAEKLGATVIVEKRTDGQGIGYGYAHQAGINAAKGSIIVTMDGDGTYPVEQIEEVVSFMLKNKFDFVSCSRFPLIHTKAISWIRKLGVAILNAEVRVLHGHPIKDILSGMWAVRKNAATKLSLKEGGWNLSPEIKLRAILHKKVKFAEFHIDHKYRTGGASKQQIWKTGFDHLFYILAFKLHQVMSIKKTHQNSSQYVALAPATSLE